MGHAVDGESCSQNRESPMFARVSYASTGPGFFPSTHVQRFFFADSCVLHVAPYRSDEFFFQRFLVVFGFRCFTVFFVPFVSASNF